MSDDLRQIAIHEAGHVVVALGLGAIPHEASIVPDASTEGRVRVRFRNALLADHLLFLEGGNAAEKAFKMPEALADLGDIVATDALLASSAKTTRAATWDARARIYAGKSLAHHRLTLTRIIRARALSFLAQPMCTVMVESVAAALLARNTLSGGEIVKIAGGPSGFDRERSSLHLNHSEHYRLEVLVRAASRVTSMTVTPERDADLIRSHEEWAMSREAHAE